MEMIRWRAWYRGGGVFDSEETEWADLPDDGLLIVAILFNEYSRGGERYRRIMMGSDWCWLCELEGRWTLCEGNETKEEILERYPDAVLKRGAWTSDEELDRVRTESLEWGR
jgi:hypothetical protein